MKCLCWGRDIKSYERCNYGWLLPCHVHPSPYPNTYSHPNPHLLSGEVTKPALCFDNFNINFVNFYLRQLRWSAWKTSAAICSSMETYWQRGHILPHSHIKILYSGGLSSRRRPCQHHGIHGGHRRF